jgi:hypothetical protein
MGNHEDMGIEGIGKVYAESGTKPPAAIPRDQDPKGQFELKG